MSKKKKDNNGPQGDLESQLVEVMKQRLAAMMYGAGERPRTGYIDEVFSKMRSYRARWAQDFISKTHICDDDCPLRMGISVSVCDREKIDGTLPDERLDAVMKSVILCSVEEHTQEQLVVMLDVETAKKVVNAIGHAISLIEQEAGVKR